MKENEKVGWCIEKYIRILLKGSQTNQEKFKRQESNFCECISKNSSCVKF